MTDSVQNDSHWTFLTNHAHVLLCVAKKPNLRLRDIAEIVGITERAVHRIITDLTDAGFVNVKREGRCNTYIMHPEKHLRHPIEAHKHVADLIHLIENG